MNNDIDQDNSDYTVRRKLWVGLGELATTAEKCKVQENNIIAGKTCLAHIFASNEVSPKVSHIKIRNFNSEKYVTTKPLCNTCEKSVKG